MKKLIGVLSILLMLGSVGNVFAAEAKIGYVDLQKALNLSEAGKTAKQQIEKKVKDYEQQINQRKEELKKAKDDLEKQALLLSEDARSSKEREYQQKLKDFQRFTKDIQDELQQRDNDFTHKILDDLIKVVAEIGKKEKYTVILEKNQSSLVYADPAIDMTDQVIKEFNRQQKK